MTPLGRFRSVFYRQLHESPLRNKVPSTVHICSLYADTAPSHRQIITGLSYGIAISIALARIFARLHLTKRLYLDDWLLLFACFCLTAATILLFYGLPTVYLIEATSLNPIGLFGGGGSGITDLAVLLQKINFFARFNWVYLILSWTTIFAVKFGFLSFFRNLVLRLPGIHQYWRVVVAVTAVVYLFSLVDGIIACPHDGLVACMSESNHSTSTMNSRVASNLRD